MRSPGGGDPIDEFEAKDPLNFRTDININKVTQDKSNPVNTGDGIFVGAGSDITWIYEVTTTGNVFLANIAVTDDQADVTPTFVSGDGNILGVLEPGETWIYKAVGTAIFGDYSNLGSVTGDPVYADSTTAVPGLSSPTANDPSSYTGIANPGITIVKTAGNAPNGTILVTETGLVTYNYEVTNTGETDLFNIVVVDDNGTPVDDSDDFIVGTIPGSLAPGASDTLTADIDVQSDRTNIAVVTGSSPEGTEVTDDDDAVVDIVAPAIEIIKTAGTALDGTVLVTEAGDVEYTFVVTNTGDTDLADVVVTDDILGDIGAIAFLPANGGTDMLTFTANIAVDTTNVATTTGNPVDEAGNDLPVEAPTDTDDAVVDIVAPAIEIIKTAGTALDGEVLITEAGTVAYSYEVTNTGETDLSNIVVVDDNGTPLDDSDDFIVGTIPGPLTPGVSETLTADIDVQSDRTNIAVATGSSPEGTEVTDDDDAVVAIADPSLKIEKFTNGMDVETADDAVEIEAGETVTWTYNVANIGNAPFDNFILSDDNGTTDDGSDDLSFELKSDGTWIEKGIIYESGDDNNNQKLDDGEVWSLKAEGIAQDLSVSIDFDESVISGMGDIITDQYNSAEFGELTISTPVNPYDAMIFDSANPTGGDWDLGTPTTPAGPGVGTDSGAGDGNVVPQNNVLIISEDGDQSDPDDNATGGTLQFNFGEINGVNLDAIGLLDIDNNEEMVTVDAFLNNTLVTSNDVAALGDNSFQMIELNGEWADQLDVNLIRSGAVTQLDYRRIYGNMATLSAQFGDTAFTSNDSSFYTNPHGDIN